MVDPITPPRSSGRFDERKRDMSADSETLPRLTSASSESNEFSSTSDLTSSSLSLAAFPPPPVTTPPESPSSPRSSAPTVVHIRGTSDLEGARSSSDFGGTARGSLHRESVPPTDRESSMLGSPEHFEHHYLQSLQAVAQHIALQPPVDFPDTPYSRTSHDSLPPIAPLNFSHKRKPSIPSPPPTGTTQPAMDHWEPTHRKSASQPVLSRSPGAPLTRHSDDYRQPFNKQGLPPRPLPTIDSSIISLESDDASVYATDPRFSQESSFQQNADSMLNIDLDLYSYGFTDGPEQRPSLGQRHSTLGEIVQFYGDDDEDMPERPSSGLSQFQFPTGATPVNEPTDPLDPAIPPDVSLPVLPTDSQIALLRPMQWRTHSGSLSSYADSQRLLNADRSQEQLSRLDTSGASSGHPDRIARANRTSSSPEKSDKEDHRLSQLSGLSGSLVLIADGLASEHGVSNSQLDGRRHAWMPGNSPFASSNSSEKGKEPLSGSDWDIKDKTPAVEEGESYFDLQVHPADEHYHHIYRMRDVDGEPMLMPQYQFPSSSSFPNKNAISPPLVVSPPFKTHQQPEPLDRHLHPFRSTPGMNELSPPQRPPLNSAFSDWTNRTHNSEYSVGSQDSNNKFVTVGPMLNVTGTPQGTGMRLVGSSPVGSSPWTGQDSVPWPGSRELEESPLQKRVSQRASLQHKPRHEAVARQDSEQNRHAGQPEKRQSLPLGTLYEQVQSRYGSTHEEPPLAYIPQSPITLAPMSPILPLRLSPSPLHHSPMLPLQSPPPTGPLPPPPTQPPPDPVAYFPTPTLPPVPFKKPYKRPPLPRSSVQHETAVQKRTKRLSRALFAVCLLFPPLLLLLGYGGMDVVITELSSHQVLAVGAAEKRVARFVGWTFCVAVVVGFIVGLIVVTVH